MKKIITLTAFILMACMLLCGCNKADDKTVAEPSFTPMDTTCVIQAYRVSDGSLAFEDILAYQIAQAYNSTAEYEAYDENATPEWEVVFMCTPTQQSAEGAENSIHRISYLGENTFNVSHDTAPQGKCKIVSEALYKAFSDAILGAETAEK